MSPESRVPSAEACRTLSAPGTRNSAITVHGALTSVAILFSLNYIISKLAMRAFTPFVFAYLRILGAALILNFILYERGAAPLSREDQRSLALYSILGVIINQTFFLGGLALTSAHVAAILITTIPIFAVAAAIAIGRERATLARIGGIALAGVGAATVIGFEGFDGASRAILGDLLIVMNSLAYALYLVLSKPMMRRLSARRVLSRMFAVAAIALLPVAAWPLWREPWHAIGPAAWSGLAAVIAGPTVAAYLLNGWALRHADSSVVAAYSYLQPVFTVFLAAIFLGEVIRVSALAAGAMILGGLYLASK